MTGRIKLLKNNTPVMGSDEPPLEYLYDELGEFDKQCGTWGLDAFQLPNLECPETFVCLDDVTDPSLVTYAKCIDAMDCHMMAGMTTKISANSPVALVRVSVMLYPFFATSTTRSFYAARYDKFVLPIVHTPDDSTPSKCGEYGKSIAAPANPQLFRCDE
jgi:hypothetical protein